MRQSLIRWPSAGTPTAESCPTLPQAPAVVKIPALFRLVPLSPQPIDQQFQILPAEDVLLRIGRRFRVGRHAVVFLAVEPLVGRIADDADEPVAAAVAGQVGALRPCRFAVEGVAFGAVVLDKLLPGGDIRGIAGVGVALAISSPPHGKGPGRSAAVSLASKLGEGLLDEPVHLLFCLNFVLPKNFGLEMPLTVRNSVSHSRLAKP